MSENTKEPQSTYFAPPASTFTASLTRPYTDKYERLEQCNILLHEGKADKEEAGRRLKEMEHSADEERNASERKMETQAAEHR